MIADFIELLRDTSAPAGCINPYTDNEERVDSSPNSAEIRTCQLESYLRRRQKSARLLLIAEAPGYQGARFSGIAMTCERTLLGGKAGIPLETVLEDGIVGRRTSCVDVARNRPERELGFCEPTASIVWKELLRHGLTDEVVLWNVFPFHPRRAGAPLSNRTPTNEEVNSTLHVAEDLLRAFPDREVLCIGNTAREHLGRLITNVKAIRHPANGGARAFREGFQDAVKHLPATDRV